MGARAASARIAAAAPPGSIGRAILLMTASTVLFGLMAVCIRLASKQLHAFEIAFFRNLFGFVFTLPLLYRHGWGVLSTNKLPLYFFRCCIGIVSMLSGLRSCLAGQSRQKSSYGAVPMWSPSMGCLPSRNV